MPDCASQLKPFFNNGNIICSEGFTPESGLETFKKGVASAICLGQLAITNPDLPERMKNNWPLNKNLDYAHFYKGGETGYTDYPCYVDWFEPLKIGAIECKNRVIMAPLTRCRAEDDGVPNDLMVKYYEQRAGFGMILTEGAQVSEIGQFFQNSGGIYTKEQVQGWKKITDAVHAKGGKIVLLIWHAGRLANPKVKGSQEIWVPSEVQLEALKDDPMIKLHQMTVEEIK